jgi:hypothetical protein
MGRAAVACALLALTSCGPPNHLSHRLEKGTEVLIVEPEEFRQYMTYTRADIAVPDYGLVDVELGTAAIVVQDLGPTADLRRQVTISIKRGEHAGTVGKLARYQLQVVSR